MFHVAFNIFAFREIRNIILENYRNYSNNSGSLELKQLQSEQWLYLLFSVLCSTKIIKSRSSGERIDVQKSQMERNFFNLRV